MNERTGMVKAATPLGLKEQPQTQEAWHVPSRHCKGKEFPPRKPPEEVQPWCHLRLKLSSLQAVGNSWFVCQYDSQSKK